MRLTQTMKDAIVGNVVADTLNRRRKKLEKDREAFGDDVYFDLFGKHVAILNNAPNGFFGKRDCVKVQFGDQVTEVRFSVSKPVPHAATGYLIYYRYSHSYSLTQRFVRLERRRQKLADDTRELKATVRVTLSTITTDKKLLKIWPEVERYLPKKTGTENLPAIPVADLNSMIADLSVVR